MQKPLSALFWALMRRAARPYVAGPALADALAVCRSIERQGIASTICCWNGDDSTAEDNLSRYLATVDAIASAGGDCYLSVKAPDLQFSPKMLDRILERAVPPAVAIHFDSLGVDTADATFALMRQCLPRHAGRYGCTIPGRWRRSLADAEQAVEAGLRVRVVKGQWADHSETQLDPSEGFFDVVDRLVRVGARQVAVATHDPALLRTSLARLRSAGIAAEAELLFGLPMRHALAVARAEGAPVRLYVPYGTAWLPYAMTQVRKNPRIAWWAFRDVCAGLSGFRGEDVHM
jgi:proline dehydrogenase